MNSSYVMYTDGGSRANPGLASIGGMIQDCDGKLILSFKQFIGISTNNVAEYTALIHGLSLCREKNIDIIECRMDSELVVKQMKGEYKIKEPNLKLLNQAAMKLSLQFKEVTFKYIPRAENKESDRLVNLALDEISL